MVAPVSLEPNSLFLIPEGWPPTGASLNDPSR